MLRILKSTAIRSCACFRCLYVRRPLKGALNLFAFVFRVRLRRWLSAVLKGGFIKVPAVQLLGQSRTYFLRRARIIAPLRRTRFQRDERVLISSRHLQGAGLLGESLISAWRVASLFFSRELWPRPMVSPVPVRHRPDWHLVSRKFLALSFSASLAENSEVPCSYW